MSHDQLSGTFQTAEVDGGWMRTFSRVTETACGCLPFPLTYGCWRRQFHDQGTGGSEAEQHIKKLKNETVTFDYLLEASRSAVGEVGRS